LVDERSRLRALLKACHEVIQQLEKLRADADNPFAKRIRETCRSVEARLKKLEIGRRRPYLSRDAD
jgi:hypothetical protein